MNKNVPLTTLERFPDYLNYLRELNCAENEKIASGAIAQALGLGEVLVRKDLAYTSCVGKPRVGYVVCDLIAALERVLGCENKRNAVIVGAGGLGRALLSYGGFIKYGIDVVAAFDNDLDKCKTDVGGKPVLHIDELNEGIKKFNAELAVICVPTSAAQNICDKLVKSGIKGILTFAPVNLKVDESITVRYVDLAANLAILNSLM